MSSEIKKQDKEALQEKAFAMYVGGSSMNEIAEAIDRHRNTARKYIQEYADSLDPGERIFRQKVSMARLDKVIAHATDLLENGDIKDSSLSRPQLLHQVTAAIKEQNKISGLHVSLMQVKHEHDTVANMVRRLAQEAASLGYDDTWAYLNGVDYDEIEDADIIEDND